MTWNGVFLRASLACAILQASSAAQAKELSAEGCAEQSPCTERDEAPIVVTGTRLALPEVAGLEPTVTLSGERIAARNLTNIADALNEMPGYRGSVTPDGVQNSFGQGVNFVNAYNLGTNRTLTLVNGRRAVSSNVPTIFGNASPGTQVDLNAIPAILVDRVERVGIGGAPVYGSDAIAGTVNVILKRDVEGIDLSATSGITEQGDNFRVNLSGLYGSHFAGGRGHLTLALSYDKVEGVRQDARGFYRANVEEVPNANWSGLPAAQDGRLNPTVGYDSGPADGIPATVLARDFTIPYLTEGGLIVGGALSQAVQFAPDGTLVPFDRGVSHGGPFATGGDGFRLNEYGQITSNLRRFSANALIDYELTDRLRLFGEALYYAGKADEIADQPDFNALLFSGVSGPLLFPVTNPFLTPQAQGLLIANGYPAFLLSRADADLGDPTGYAQTRLYRGVIGLDGELDLAGRDWRFELALTYGRTDFTDHDQQIDQQKFVNAVNVTRNAGGQIVCDAAPWLPVAGIPVADPACRPLDLFGAGRASSEALGYILTDVTARSRLEQWDFAAHIGGSPFTLFGNAGSIDLGYEHRAERARFAPDAFLQAGLGRSVPVPPTGGHYDVDELSGELLLPLVTPDNGGPIHRFDLFARGRYTHNSVTGGSLAWSAGGRFQPIPDVTLRGNFTRSFRSPSITELYAPLTSARISVPDLCSASQINSGPNPAIRARNCAAFLDAYPLATPLLASFVTVPGLSGGNSELANEKADSWTLGLVLQPRSLPGLTLSADYLSVTIHDPIAYLSVAEVASACFDNPDFDLADPAHANAWCAAIGRDGTGQVLSDPLNPAVRSGFVNGHEIRFSGIEASLAYTTALERIGLPGALSLAGDLFYVRRRVQNLTGVADIRLDGLIGDPQFQGQLRLGWADRHWGIAAQVNYTGEQLFSREDRGPSPSDAREIDELDDFVTVDASLFVEPLDGLRINFAVTNLFNRQGESYYGALIPASINDALGRRFSLSVSKRL